MLQNPERSQKLQADPSVFQLIAAYYRVLIKRETFPPEFTEKLLLKASESPKGPIKDEQLREADLAIYSAVGEIVELLRNPDQVSRRWFERSRANQTSLDISHRLLDLNPESNYALHPISLMKVITTLVTKRIHEVDRTIQLPSITSLQHAEHDEDYTYSEAGMGQLMEKYWIEFSPTVTFKIERVLQRISRFMNEAYENDRLVLTIELNDPAGQLEDARQSRLRDMALTLLQPERLQTSAENSHFVEGELDITHDTHTIASETELQQIIDTLIKDQGYFLVENNLETQQVTLANAAFEVFLRKSDDQWHITAKAQEFNQERITTAEKERALAAAREILQELLDSSNVKNPVVLSSFQANNFGLFRLVRDRARESQTRQHLILDLVRENFQAIQPAEIGSWLAEKSAQLAQDGVLPSGITIKQGEYIWQVKLQFSDNGQPKYDVEVWKMQT